MKVLVHIVTFNHAKTLGACLESVLKLDKANCSIHILVSDNCSRDESVSVAKEKGVEVIVNKQNLGFAGAHNQAVAQLISDFDFLLILNPDLALKADAVVRMLEQASRDPTIGILGPLLYRADAQIQPVIPAMFDSCGMCMCSSLRHFDMGSNEPANTIPKSQDVFGISGACLLIKKECAQDLLLSRGKYESDLYSVYPQLAEEAEQRPQLFDEAFFAYREDADLAWRAQLFAWKSYVVTEAVGYHVRHVVPENRKQLAPEINSLGVRNRFLLQINNFPLCVVPCAAYFKTFMNGFLIRNFIVFVAVFFLEPSSIKGLRELWILRRRALSNRKQIFERKKTSWKQIFRWFDSADRM